MVCSVKQDFYYFSIYFIISNLRHRFTRCSVIFLLEVIVPCANLLPAHTYIVFCFFSLSMFVTSGGRKTLGTTDECC